MIGVNDSQMAVEDRERVAVGREFRIEGNSLFLGIEVRRTEKAFALCDGNHVDRCGRALDAMRDMPNQHVASESTLDPGLAFAQSLQALEPAQATP